MIPVRSPRGRGTLNESPRCLLVGLDQSVRAELLEVAHGTVDPFVIEPRLAVRAYIDLAERRPQPISQQHVAEVGALGQLWNVGITLQPLPAHALELFAGGLLDQIILPLDAHRRSQTASGGDFLPRRNEVNDDTGRRQFGDGGARAVKRRQQAVDVARDRFGEVGAAAGGTDLSRDVLDDHLDAAPGAPKDARYRIRPQPSPAPERASVQRRFRFLRVFQSGSHSFASGT